MSDHRAPRVPAALDRAPRAPVPAGPLDDDVTGVEAVSSNGSSSDDVRSSPISDAAEEGTGALPAPYETEAPTDDLVLIAAALGAAALLVTVLSGLLPALGPTVRTTAWLLGATGLAVSVVAVRRRTPASRTAVAGVALSAAALLLSAVLVVVGAAGQLT
ncbi:hypothetical protein [Quadrisphaera setariae]|uniref:Uncharacterized protein n=1 Tax=Quadrisphaera setariae TaxID=2593304 RepID=A0A5C8ZE69_9ACTN|nr:hypothetical protein [Quadrisphaera setariae]TXR55478.1 hypothetical protein FMM08_14275 [Quadrisphaera setariae]